MGKADLVKGFANDEQDPQIVQQVHERVSEILTSGEEIQYIAVQKKPLLNVWPESVVLTNKRLILYQPSLLGNVSFQDHIWRDLRDVQLRENMFGAVLFFTLVNGVSLNVPYLPKVQARRLYSIAQENEEKVREERRLRELEDKRAAAGGVVMHAPASAAAPVPSAPQMDPVEKLQKLKAMADAGLITAPEYEAKKADILASM